MNATKPINKIGVHKLRYVTITELPSGNINIKLNKAGREEIKTLESREGWMIEHIVLELIEDSRCNYGFDIVQPEKIGALTDSMIIGYEVDYDDDGNFDRASGIWWYPEYQVSSELAALKSRQGITLTKAD
jgi:hypothetical protein